MLLDIVITAIIITATVVIHASGMMMAVRIIRNQRASQVTFHRFNSVQLVGIVLMMFFVSVVEVLLWAVTYLAVNAIESFEEAFYFSMVTFTTLGYGDILIDANWRLMAACNRDYHVRLDSGYCFCCSANHLLSKRCCFMMCCRLKPFVTFQPVDGPQFTPRTEGNVLFSTRCFVVNKLI